MLYKNLLTDNCQIQPRKHLCLEDTNKMLMFMESKEKHKELEKCLDSQLWHACAGGMVQMPPVNSKVYYFPQGHAEHACGQVDFRNLPHVPASVLCRVSAIQFLADSETDEVYAKLKLIPLRGSDFGLDDEEAVINGAGGEENKPASFAKTLTQSDANNGGGFSVPRYCAETIFPRLDYSADPPVQTILAKDVHGETWKFRHIYRGTPRRHLLTTGWSTFVNHKKLVAGDSIVFLRANNGDLCVGIRRAKRGFGGGPESSWNPAGGNCGIPYGCFTSFLKEDEHKLMRNGNANGSSLGLNGGLTGMGKLRPESVIEAASLATAVQPFEVVYYPRSSSPEFCVKASLVKAAMHKRWFPGLRFKMAFETEDSSRISWFMGTVSSAQAADPLRWPDSPWRLLQVTWDEPDLLQNVKRVSPWLVELVPTMPAVHLSPYAPPRKKLRFLPQSDFPLDGQFPLPGYSSTYLGLTSLLASPPENGPAGMQGARHAHYGLSLSDIHLKNLQKGHFLDGFSSQLDRSAVNSRAFKSSVMHNPSINENISCMLTMTNSTQTSKKPDDTKVGQLVLFGQTILTEQQISQSCSNDTAPVCTGNSSSEGNFDKMANFSDGSGSARHPQSRPEQSSCEGSECYKQDTDNSTDNGHCKVFVESKHVSHTLDLSLLKSYEELRHKLGNMFRIEDSKPLGNVYYRDVTGAVRQIGDEPFRDFMKSARTIVTDSSGDNVGV